MKMRRLVALGAAASLAAIAFVSSATPANAWTREDCVKTWTAGKDHPDCEKYKTTTTTAPKTTTTLKATTSTAAPTTTVAVKPETKPTPVKVKPKFTG
jgi:hypothetical protein